MGYRFQLAVGKYSYLALPSSIHSTGALLFVLDIRLSRAWPPSASIEGYSGFELLGKKFCILYALCEQQLSKQRPAWKGGHLKMLKESSELLEHRNMKLLKTVEIEIHIFLSASEIDDGKVDVSPVVEGP